MRKRLKKELARLYEAPPAQRKEEFFWGVEKPGISHWQFLRIQISYVRKWNWAVALLMLATVNLGWLEGQILWIMTPAFVLLWKTKFIAFREWK